MNIHGPHASTHAWFWTARNIAASSFTLCSSNGVIVTRLNTRDLDQVQRFPMLSMGEEHGAMVKEAMLPKQ
ncbi:MAG: hypothetical protein ACI9TH_003000 [Kiritimatiellia bacterium]|jgi:hypothetical protein